MALLIFKEINKVRTPFILICFLRIVKFEEFKEKDKIFVLKFMESYIKKNHFDFNTLIQITSTEIDQIIVYTNPDNIPKPPVKRKTLLIKKKKKNEEDDDDLFEFPNVSVIKREESKNTITKPKEKQKGKDEAKINDNPESPKFNFKGN